MSTDTICQMVLFKGKIYRDNTVFDARPVLNAVQQMKCVKSWIRVATVFGDKIKDFQAP